MSDDEMAEDATIDEPRAPRLEPTIAHSLYAPGRWYWLVGNRDAVAFSSERAAYVPEDDAAYVGFLALDADGKPTQRPTRIATDGELADVLMKANLPRATIRAAGWTSWGAVPVADQALVLRAVGCEVNSASQPALSGVYSLDDTFISRLATVARSITDAGNLPHGGETVSVPDVDGSVRQFSQDAFMNLYNALQGYLYNLAVAELSGAEQVPWPKQPVDIA